MDELFRTLEQHDMTIYHLAVSVVNCSSSITVFIVQFSKIGKVMRHIAALSEDKIPRNDKYDFGARAQTLVDGWYEILNRGFRVTNYANRAEAENCDGTEVYKDAVDVDVPRTELSTSDKDGSVNGPIAVQ